MATFCEGTVEIDLVDFWEFVLSRAEFKRGEHAFVVPRVNKGNQTIEIDLAYSTDSNPADLATKPECLNQWNAE